ncbi:2-octaprenyl-6-methoxyphenyl hydroxylase [Thermochromatium tepidum]|uniref:2-octaprenyl-6-methoxyphenyl hydroxylase n=1 Tax=Thermochromatium tepidum ATCC 43061 TaxID=316276 RepID=A0A6I6EA48_THETI|nr:2-octaprenyl-6-methoxyphenyl hydroxylase [Thermochromatium tepidum]QGU33468.1 2-octaprenyl-6-methoxyphenyl hydroxylase [Thermochromatium tepidum ATCC 43061]
MAEFDVVIVGGGLVGGSLAAALRALPLRVALIESAPVRTPNQPSPDERVIALSLGSRRIFGGLGVWPAIAPVAEPILSVHISDRGYCGFTRLECHEVGVEAFGYVTPARALDQVLQEVLEPATNIHILRPARLLDHQAGPIGVALDIQVGDERRGITTRLLVAADGGDSSVRDRLGIRVEGHDYGQDAVVTTVLADRPCPGQAFERFTDTGPLAMLPMPGGRYSVVWTCRPTETAELLALTESDFSARLQARFGWRLGRLSAPSPRQAYPLRLRLVRETIHERLVLIGNAAHTLHPVAGQGFNLGLRDVAALAEVLGEAARCGQDPGSADTLADYKRWRGRDQVATAWLTDTLARLFVVPWRPVRLARNLGLLGLDLVPAARRRLARRLMGLAGALPRLARGLPLEAHHV